MAAEYFFRFRTTSSAPSNRATQAYRPISRPCKPLRPPRGGMHWKKIGGREYLYKYRDRYGHGCSSGPGRLTPKIYGPNSGRQAPGDGPRAPGGPRRRFGQSAPVLPGGLDPSPRPVTRILRRLTRAEPHRHRRSW